MKAWDLLVDRTDLSRTAVEEVPTPSIEAGQVLLRVDRVGMTANNVTYAVFGDAMHYWDFFPTGDPASGCIPVWGFATVTESRAEGVDAGERFYGYWPIADEATVSPVRVIDEGFVDGTAHRANLPPVYNRYLRCSSDPQYRTEHEGLIALLRPLFITSFLIDDFLADNAFFDASTVLVASASSKTAYGLGFCLAQRRGAPGLPTIVGLTSAKNVAFTERLGCYDRVIAYDALASLPAASRSVYVDMSGDAALRAAVHGHWGDALRYSCSVGGTHWQSLGGGKGLPGPRPVLFFAPDQIRKRLADWGATGLQERLASAWSAFVARVGGEPPWLRIVAGDGRDAVERTYGELLDGRVAADEGRVLSL